MGYWSRSSCDIYMQGSTAQTSEKKLQEKTSVGIALIQKLHNSVISKTGSKKMVGKTF